MTAVPICGPHAVLAALRRHPERLESVWLDAVRDDRRIEEVAKTARAAGVRVKRVPRATLDRLADGVRHQGVVARRQAAAAHREDELRGLLSGLSGAALLLVLDGVQDPHNLGACLRSADAAGAHAVIVPRDNAASLTAVAQRAASGAAETVPVFRVTNLARCLRELKEQGVWIMCATEDAEAEVYDVDLRGPVALVLGGEGRGLRRLTREHCDVRFRIPMAGTVGNLNVSVAAGVALFEAVRQRRRG